MTITRRDVLLGGLVLSTRTFAAPSFSDEARAIEANMGGRLGVFASRGTTSLGYREAERFAYCSTFKWVLAAAVLHAVQRRRLTLQQHVSYSAKDLVEPSTITGQHVVEGAMTVGDLCAATIAVSDNTAANLLEPLVGGRRGLQAFVRTLGDKMMRFDRIEPDLNTNLSGDVRDTTTPQAMTQLLERVLVGNVLNAASKDQLLAWMQAATTGLARIRASVPDGWLAADKTGTGAHAAANDVAVVRPPTGLPIYLTVFTTGPDGAQTDAALHNPAIAAIAKCVFDRLGAA